MATQKNVGSRIREKRLDRGLRQADVAERVGISPSYLNLIEHNRRRIGGKLLANIARILHVDVADLTEGVDSALLDQMRNAAIDSAAKVEDARAEEMAGRYPGWAALIGAQAQRIAALQQQLQLANDRMAYDPQLAASLHEVISAVTAIRSSSSILVGPEQLDEDWQRRFHQNIHDDSLRLAANSEALVSYLEVPSDEAGQITSPFEQMEAYLSKHDYHLAALEEGTDLAFFLTAADLGAPATDLLRRYALQYIRDADWLPLSAFEAACKTHSYDPGALTRAFDVPFDVVLRRLAALPQSKGHPSFGLAICDAAGALTLLKPIPDFTLPRTGSACPLWPLYSSLSRPAQPVCAEVVLAGHDATRLLCYAIATPAQVGRLDVPSPMRATMLVVSDPPEALRPPLPVGMSCRLCPHTDCSSRREPAMVSI